MSESPKIQKIYDESYFMFKKLIGEIFIIPLILYILAISFITHVSIFNQPLKSQINTYLARKRKILFLILIFLYICHIISLFNITKLETSANTISSNMTLITLLFYIMSIMAVLLTIYSRILGSISPHLVPIIIPASGVNPIEVSITLPESIAVILPPFPI